MVRIGRPVKHGYSEYFGLRPAVQARMSALERAEAAQLAGALAASADKRAGESDVATPKRSVRAQPERSDVAAEVWVSKYLVRFVHCRNEAEAGVAENASIRLEDSELPDSSSVARRVDQPNIGAISVERTLTFTDTNSG